MTDVLLYTSMFGLRNHYARTQKRGQAGVGLGGLVNMLSPLASGGIFSNGDADVNGWASRFQSEVRIVTINITFVHLILLFLYKYS